ncbi:hypothetical protein TanjilG_11868 [Lupinus angustifolius]|uniref:Uncharacterized protein n=1 Tax=Lupinus angustifolius TaxID=3871 RepID=A0A394DJK5_LUPAN|nr:PREDICTED: uncharacterized protein LOC109338360 [Lupinus angustifolius]XP_019431116.1 PREDICTED: uncharacterized protein LOC109338360 [Lupinus angustifolius]OIW20467.1 hypothetical protein TanjilG_11868 [Lupinus angustifolius]
MAEINNTHIVEIPVDQEHHQHHLCSSTSMFEAIEDHPLTEISESPGHLLLLKLWQREEKLFAQHIAKKETRLYSIKSELFQLCSFFFIFHGFFITLLFNSWANANSHNKSVCKKWWVPSMVSLCTSLVFVVLAQVKLVRYWKVWAQLQREKSDSRTVGRCIQELRMKGASFDLSKEPLCGKKKGIKSSSVEIKWKPITWCSNNLLTICLFCFTGLAFPASKLILCGL